MRARKPAPRAEFGINRIHSLVRGKLKTGLVTWPFCSQITRFWLFYFLFGLEKNVWPFGSILAFLSNDRNFYYFLV
jgi:hypothetical protein